MIPRYRTERPQEQAKRVICMQEEYKLAIAGLPLLVAKLSQVAEAYKAIPTL